MTILLCLCSDMCGVAFGGAIEAVAEKLGLPSPNLTAQQLQLRYVPSRHLMADTRKKREEMMSITCKQRMQKVPRVAARVVVLFAVASLLLAT